LVEVKFQVDALVIAYIMQERGIKDYGISLEKWKELLKKASIQEVDEFVRKIRKELTAESFEAEHLKVAIKKKWSQHRKNVLTWLRQLTRVSFRTPEVRVCVVPFAAGQVPFKDLPLIIVGKIRQGWDYPETIAHELAHILFNQNFKLENEVEHLYIQLIEEEIAVRLGARSKYFDYQVPDFAGWVRKAQQREKVWKHYVQHVTEFRNVSQFIVETEKTSKTALL
jgi:hypothetical protein